MSYSNVISINILSLFSTLKLINLSLVTLFLLCVLSPLEADETVPNDKKTTDTILLSELDGKSFSGDIGLIGKPASAQDLLLFNDGMFISKGCEKRCGYTAAEYQVRNEGEYVEVTSETPCLKSDATIVWRGKVKGDEIEGTFTWINRRWYWSFEKEYWFKGKLVELNSKTIDKPSSN